MEEYQQVNISQNNFEQCVKCTICTVYCPVTAVNPVYPGPKQAGPDSERYRLKHPEFFDEALKYCLNCKRCEVACPSDVRIGDIIQAARMKYSKKSPKLRDRILANTDFMGSMATMAAPLVNLTVGLAPVKRVMDATLAIDHHRTFPKYAGQKFTTWFNRKAQAEQAKYDKKVVYFHGCYVNYNYPQLGKDFVKVMNAVGYGVELMNEERCCGVAKIANGLYDQAKRDAGTNVSAMKKALEGKSADTQVVGASSTCILTMRDEYPHLLGVENGDIRDRINLVTRFLYNLVEAGKIKLAFRPDFKMKAVYHTPCHMAKLGWGIYTVSMLRMIPGVELEVLPEQCCGMSGTYGFKKENYEYSQAIGESLFASIKATGVQNVVTDCETCKWQIEMSMPGVKVM
ncbi:MAG: anaerobic glycerol-3-phosphate dehydrogenase subunit C, partial [Muribaculaceae bacterium]|nr:anaerobic glycerol-3-phosphate dehydrogenase subunit C [Muribaculaceae bacterium]